MITCPFLSSSRTSNRGPQRQVSVAGVVSRVVNRGPQTARQVLCLALLLAVPGGAQSGPPDPHGQFSQPLAQQPSSEPGIGAGDPVWEAKRLRMMNADRQKSMVADANRLLKLVQELDAQVTSANPGSLNADQLRRLAEIEKLAHSVKDKMRTSLAATPVYRPELSPMIR
jgi:hypothetical protein